MQILIDTNIYLDFYRSTDAALKVLDEVEKHFDRIILTDQIIFEFERSREAVLRGVKKNFENESNLHIFRSSYVLSLAEFQELLAIQKQYMEQRGKVLAVLEETLKNEFNDPVAAFFRRLSEYAIDNSRLLPTDEEIMSAAHRRKLIGNPPTTADKYSIGDEINWEIILKHIKDDMIIVGRDGTYINNFSFLQKEFKKVSGKELYEPTKTLTGALEMVGVKLERALKEIEEKMIEEVRNNNNPFWQQK